MAETQPFEGFEFLSKHNEEWAVQTIVTALEKVYPAASGGKVTRWG